MSRSPIAPVAALLLFAGAASAQPPGGMPPGGMPPGGMPPGGMPAGGMPGMQGPAPALPSTDPTKAESGRYSVEAGHTRVLFSVSHMGFSNWYGDFTGASGMLVLDTANPSASHVEVSLPVASITTTNAKLDDELKGAGWLDAGQFPTATFHSRETRVTGPGRADVMGELTLHGVTKPLTLHVKFNAAGPNPMMRIYTVGFEAHGTFKRSEFGVTRFLPLIGDDVDLIIAGAFVRAPA